MDIAVLLPLFTALPLILGGILVVGHRFQLLQDIVLFATLSRRSICGVVPVGL